MLRFCTLRFIEKWPIDKFLVRNVHSLATANKHPFANTTHGTLTLNLYRIFVCDCPIVQFVELIKYTHCLCTWVYNAEYHKDINVSTIETIFSYGQIGPKINLHNVHKIHTLIKYTYMHEYRYGKINIALLLPSLV